MPIMRMFPMIYPLTGPSLGRCLTGLTFMLFISLTLQSCSDQVLDHENPDVDVFVRQLKAGTYSAPSEGMGTVATGVLTGMPQFTEEDIDELLDYAEDLTAIPSFPLSVVSYPTGGRLRLGECILWVVETIRLGQHASMGCKMVHTDAEDYEGIYFLTDNEVLDAAAHYRRWWEGRKYPQTVWTVDTCYDEPLCGSGYMWW